MQRERNIESNLVAVLGPTNTGKTHRAIERMLEFRSGMMGFPLRLLAREVYERVSAQVGEQKVALLTGEERKIPKHARYWLCTVEAMPEALDVEFLAVDEIQLAADRERGHVFTQRLLKARGRCETWFLGSLSMLRTIRALIPHVRVERLTRLSTLRYGGKVSLSGLPPRTAVVALSRKELYPIAEHIRQRKGGVALVLGALSPNARNAQVDLFQSGKVDYLVATDAIGMGLNLDLSNVVFASVAKFDGQRRRRLSTQELGQIAGRAGRHLKDGTFFTLHNGPQLDAQVIRDIEEHRVHNLTRLVWRNDELDFQSSDHLVASLRAAPSRKIFQKLQKADDFEALLWLRNRPAVLPRLKSPERLRLLWTVCQIPDYRRLLLDRHFLLLESIFVQLCQRNGELCPDWLAQKLKDADCTAGGIEVLMTRLAFVRTWSYVTHRPGWLADPLTWQASARAVEEKLSAALHEALTLRFLERGAGARGKSVKPASSQAPRPRRNAVKQQASLPVDADHPFAVLLERLAQSSDAQVTAGPSHWLERWLLGDDAALTLTGEGQINWEAQAVARLARGDGFLRPQITLEPFVDEQLNVRERASLQRRLHAFVLSQVTAHLVNAELLGKSRGFGSDAGRALRYALAVNGGVSPWSEVAPEWRRGCEHGLEGLHEGWLYVYCKNADGKDAQRVRDALVSACGSSSKGELKLPSWVLGVHRFEERVCSIAALEAVLERRLSIPEHALQKRVAKDLEPPFELHPTQWYALLARLGWTQQEPGVLVYQPKKDRSRKSRARTRRPRP